MILAIDNIEIPEQWEHKPNIKNKYGYTAALLYASKGLIPPKQWEHSKFIQGIYYDDYDFQDSYDY